MCEIDDGERCDVWHEEKRKAAKPHTCDCCRAEIRIGETYVRHFSAYEGHGESQKKCLACDAAIAEFAAHPGHCSFQPSYFPDALQECIWEGVSVDEDDNEVLDEESAHWKAMLDAIKARRPAQVAS